MGTECISSPYYLSPDETKRLHRHICFLVRQYGLDDYADVDDTFQEVQIAFYSAIRKRDGAAIEYRLAFLRQIAFRLIRKILNDKQTQQKIAQNLGHQYSESSQNCDGLDQIHLSELIRAARTHLTAQENELIELRITQGMAWFDICRHYRDQGETWSPDTLRQRYSRIKLKLKTSLLERGIDSSDI
jgi:DNA-directed RNA polymerase specialized sigma24 family protein